MKQKYGLFSSLLVGALVFTSAGATAQDAALKQELQQSITKGLDFLKSQQNEAGFWVTPKEPGLSALVIAALMNDPSRGASKEAGPEAAKGYDFLLKNVKPDGGIYAEARANYNTSIALSALVHRARPEDEQIIRKARKFVADQQVDLDQKGKADNPIDGGIGYEAVKEGSRASADLSNTAFALEALYYSKKLFEDSGKPVEKKDDLNWGAAVQFLEKCQIGKDDKAGAGAFSYMPPNPGEGKKGKDGKVAMRYYGSISYAGMLSFIYAGMTPDDPRVKAALQWLGDNYTVDENPGMGAEGLYYYYHTMAKALATADLAKLKTKSGDVDWRSDLGKKLISLQGSDGSWKNTVSGRWMESDPTLVTAYTVLALEQVHRSLK